MVRENQSVTLMLSLFVKNYSVYRELTPMMTLRVQFLGNF